MQQASVFVLYGLVSGFAFQRAGTITGPPEINGTVLQGVWRNGFSVTLMVLALIMQVASVEGNISVLTYEDFSFSMSVRHRYLSLTPAGLSTDGQLITSFAFVFFLGVAVLLWASFVWKKWVLAWIALCACLSIGRVLTGASHLAADSGPFSLTSIRCMRLFISGVFSLGIGLGIVLLRKLVRRSSNLEPVGGNVTS